MANPIIINPTLTLAGQAAAFNASNDGLDLKITHVSFGLAHYDPTGEELALVSPVGNKVPVAGGSRPTPYQIRMASTWREDVGDVPIGEIAYWAGETLAFVWSKADGSVAAYKTNGVAYVMFNDLAFSSVPPNSISFVVDPDESVALAALVAHEGANNAHPQYALRAKFPDYQGHLWGDVTGSANAIELTLPAIVELTQYIKGNRFSFKATLTNTGDTTINVEGVGPVQVLKTGGVPLTAGSIVAGGVYDVYHDGAKFQLTAGAGFASAEVTDAEAIALTDTNSTSWVSLRRLVKALLSFAKLAGATFTGDVKGLTPAQFDNDLSFVTSAFVKRMGLEYGDYTNYSATAVLTVADIGKIAAFAGAGAMTATLPTGGTIPRGAVVKLLCGMGTLTVQAGAGESIDAVNYVGNIAMALGDTAEFIRIGTLWRLIGGSVALKYSDIMSGPNWVTPAQFSNDKTLVTAEYARRQGLQYSWFTTLSVSTALTLAEVGGLVSFSSAAALTGTLPATNTIPASASAIITVVCAGAGALTISPAAGGDTVNTSTGVIGSIVMGLGDTAEFIRLNGQWRLIGGTMALKYGALMAGPNWTTQPQFTADKSLATCEVVMREKGGYSGFTAIAASRSATAADAGKLLFVAGPGMTFTLPTPVSLGLAIGTSIGVFATSNSITIVPGAGATLNNVAGTVSSAALLTGQGLTLVAIGTNGWQIVSSTSGLGSNADFAALMAASGWKKSPSGDIEQWGVLPAIAANSSVVITFPIAFPTNLFSVIPSPGATAAAAPGVGYQAISLTQVRFWNLSASVVSLAGTWRANGN